MSIEDRFGIKEARDALSQPPTRRWPDGVLHHGARLALLLGLALAVHLLFPVVSVRDFPVLEKGMVAEEDVIARVAFPIYKAEAELMRERAEAAASIPAIFDFVPAATDTMLSRVRMFLTHVDSAVASGETDAEERSALREVLSAYGFAVTDETVDVLRSRAQRQRLSRALTAAIRNELPAGVVSSVDLETGAAPLVRVKRAGSEELVARDSLITASRFRDRAGRHLPAGSPPEIAEMLRLVLIRFFQPSLTLNEPATEAARERARQAVPVTKGEVLKGEKIVGAHEQIRDPELERLRAYREHLEQLGELDPGEAPFSRVFGDYLFDLLVLSVFGLLLFYFRPTVYADLRHVALIAFLILALVAAGAVIQRSGAPTELLPIAFPALVVAALWDGRMALNLSLVLAVLLSGQAPFLGVSVLFTMVMGGAAASMSVRVVRRRAQTWVFISIIAAAYALALISLGLLHAREPAEVGWSIAWATLNAIASALLAMGFLPLFEAFTRITTDQTLLELTDLNRPLLRRLSLEAPGTYAHSVSVANLAEAAARAVDANALLTRVGIYYHDVGKMSKPQYFIENQPQGRNPHDKLKPTTSAAIVRNHVLEGLRLADEAKLPDVVKAFIAEHHGTQQIGFFADRARESNPDADFNPADFAYPGPRPQSKETAIAMLADSCESAARVLPDPTPERIRDLVDRIVAGKISAGQLDDTPLTLAEMTRIKEQFAQVLTGMYHHRIDYPPARDQEQSSPPARDPAAVHG